MKRVLILFFLLSFFETATSEVFKQTRLKASVKIDMLP